jgi:hypothetical protein
VKLRGVSVPVTIGARPWPLSRGAVMALLAALVLLCSVALDLVLLPHDGALGHDFSAFYAAGLTLRQGHDPYNWPQLGATEAHLRSVGDPRQPMGFNPYANPPLFTWAMAAFTVVPEGPAYVIWPPCSAAWWCWRRCMAGTDAAGRSLSSR